MAESHSEWQGNKTGVVCSELINGQWAHIKIIVPHNFDYKKQGPKLLRDIESAANLFFKPGETNED